MMSQKCMQHNIISHKRYSKSSLMSSSHKSMIVLLLVIKYLVNDHNILKNILYKLTDMLKIMAHVCVKLAINCILAASVFLKKKILQV